MSIIDDRSWDPNDVDDGFLPQSAEAFDRKFEEWAARDWPDWLAKNLTFPFTVTREEDDDDAYFAPGAAKARSGDDRHPDRQLKQSINPSNKQAHE